MMRVFFLSLLFVLVSGASSRLWANQRVASIELSQTFINEQLKAHMKPGLFNDMTVELDPTHGQIFLRGLLQVPVEELRAVNLDPALGSFRFQLTVRPEATKEGYLIFEFPLNETFFYPAQSKNPSRDRVFVPVQMLSLALASARGYFAALAGDFSGFERKTAKLKALIKALDKAITAESAAKGNADALDAMKTERESLRLQLAAVPIEQKQLKNLSKEVAGMLGFAGEKELNLNDQLVAHQNALVIKLDLARFVPYLTGVELGGLRILHNSHDGPKGENYFSIDINADTVVLAPLSDVKVGAAESSLKTPPSAMLRINQALFESELVVSAEKKAMGSKLSGLKIELKADGVHVSGEYHRFFLSIPFDTLIDFDTTGTDVFEVSIREIEIAGLDLDFLTDYVLETVKNRLDQTLKGICKFEYVGDKKDHSRSLEVTVDPQKLVPALPGLHIVDIDVRNREFLFKVGKP